MLLVLFSGIVAISYVYILVEQNVSDLGYHGMGIMAILICISLLRIPWAYLLVTNTTIIAFFLLCSYFLMERVPISNYIEVTTYFIIVILFTSIIQKQMSTEQREKYLQGENLRLLSVTDKLTGCYNRLWFDSKLKEFSFFRDDDPGSKFSIIMLDVDNFKKVNDTHGHLVGDRVLQECVDLVRGVSRPKDYCARWGARSLSSSSRRRRSRRLLRWPSACVRRLSCTTSVSPSPSPAASVWLRGGPERTPTHYSIGPTPCSTAPSETARIEWRRTTLSRAVGLCFYMEI